MAGRFYPSNRRELEAQIDGYLEVAAAALAGDDGMPKAVIAPHAGTVYSGPIAASAYARLTRAPERIERVVLIGPCHHVRFAGVAISSAQAFETPLGAVPIDGDAVGQLLSLAGVVQNDEAHRQEHSLEVHLPFLQRMLGAFSLVPLVVGQASATLVGRVLDEVWGGPETLIVVSSDLSHFHDYETARVLDRETSRLIETLSLDALTGERACGYQAIRGVLQVARERQLSVGLIDLRSSGDTAGPRSEVVGYGAYTVA